MGVKGSLKNLARRSVLLCATTAESAQRDHRNVDIVLAAALREADALSSIHDPVAYVDFLRACIEPARHGVTEVKPDLYPADVAAKRFTTLVEELRRGLPAVEFSVAKEIALIADKNRVLAESHKSAQWVGDVGLHFSISSSFGNKGRVLFNIVRFARSQNCLELGTAYGMSALFILAALTTYAKSGHLATLEGFEPQFSLSSSLLKRQYGENVTCHFGKTASALPQLVNSLGTIDFMFHDCGHSRDDYIRDFNHVSKILAPGAVVLFDDIRWENPRFVPDEGSHVRGMAGGRRSSPRQASRGNRR